MPLPRDKSKNGTGSKDGRDSKGKWQKGVKNGGPRPGSGKKPDEVRRAFLDALDDPCAKDPSGRSLMDVGWDLAYDAMVARDENKSPTLAGVRVFQMLVAYKEGKPIERKEIRKSSLHLLAEIGNLLDHRAASASTLPPQLNGHKEIVDGTRANGTNGAAGSANGHH